ncbi:hypothetical protein [Paraburkholderia sp. J10-1]|uniref:tetratricopeptide repeat protein n=1 Tax=Paraburkholderia sp. J10-1 TaxID=2805430 RepID=UPI002AB5F759|nr:hypothetical protein [Paraburkholderia sp. J10-1]
MQQETSVPGAVADDGVIGMILRLLERSDDDALKLIEGSISRWPADGRLPFLRGAILVGMDRRNEARSDFARSVLLCPELHVARFMLGLIDLESGKVDDAKQVWEGLANLDEDNVLRMFANGLFELVADDFEGAATTLRAARAINHDFPAINRYVDDVIERITSVLNAKAAQTADNVVQHYLLGGYIASSTRH